MNEAGGGTGTGTGFGTGWLENCGFGIRGIDEAVGTGCLGGTAAIGAAGGLGTNVVCLTATVGAEGRFGGGGADTGFGGGGTTGFTRCPGGICDEGPEPGIWLFGGMFLC